MVPEICTKMVSCHYLLSMNCRRGGKLEKFMSLPLSGVLSSDYNNFFFIKSSQITDMSRYVILLESRSWNKESLRFQALVGDMRVYLQELDESRSQDGI